MFEELPDGWTTASLNELGTIGRGKSRHRPRHDPILYGGKYPFVQTGDVKAADGRLTSFTQTYNEVGLAQSKLWPKGTLCITIAANIAETALLDFEACFPDSVVGFVANPSKADVRFAHYAMGMVRSDIHHQVGGTGSAQDNINIDFLERLQLPVPPLAEQKAIAAILGALDDKIDLNRQMNRTLEEMASALFERAVATVDGDPTFEISVQALIDARMLMLGDGYRAKNDELSKAGLPFARAGNIDAGFHFDDADLLGWNGVKKAGSKVSEPFDVVFTSKGTVGRFAFVGPATPKFAYSPQLCFWRSLKHDMLSPYFLCQWMRSTRFLDQVDAVKGQTDMADYVSLTDQRLMKLDCPGPEVHQRYAEDVAPLWSLHFANTAESQTLTALRDLLLPQLLSGEIRIRDAENLAAAHL